MDDQDRFEDITLTHLFCCLRKGHSIDPVTTFLELFQFKCEVGNNNIIFNL